MSNFQPCIKLMKYSFSFIFGLLVSHLSPLFLRTRIYQVLVWIFERLRLRYQEALVNGRIILNIGQEEKLFYF